ncbi:chitin-binding domain protein thawb isoform 2-T6 [Cochliomyia hominivorax]
MLATRSFKGKLFLTAFVLLVLFNFTVAESRTHIPARILAKQTGATQFEEEQYETHADCSDHKHHLKKRASDEDVDYEVYQGVVGRPGIDFPIYPRIPKTSFSCRSYGNGYFADMETDCQVFHICEEGRKISFLCPNGTIFQQSELTCDWWFKVNCLGSSGFYADSTELLNKQRVQRLKPSIPVQGFNIVGGGLNIKPRVPAKGSSRSKGSSISANNGHNKPERRIDSDEAPSVESVDFDDLSAEKQRGASAKPEISNIDNNDNENESQVAAESASFVSNRNRNNYNYDKVKLDNTPKTSSLVAKNDHNRRGNGDRGSQRHGYNDPNSETTERARNGHRGQQRYREEKKPETPERNEKVKPSNKKDKIIVDSSNDKSNNPTSSYNSGTYTTARRFESTRTTPFYTPTVPSVSKSKTTEGKTFYVKGATATTPTPHRFNVNNNGAGIFLESAGSAKTTANPVEFEITAPTTLKPIIIGMRHYFDKDSALSSAEFEQNKPKNKLNVEVPSRKANHKYDDEIVPTSTPITTGPTYLPKSKAAPKAPLDAAGDSLLFAPISVPQEEVSRNVNDMLKTISALKHNFDDVELIKVNGKNRLGLDIPASSGPDALISLAHYFATEHENASKNLNSLEDNDNKKTAQKHNNANGNSGIGNRSGNTGFNSNSNGNTDSVKIISYDSENANRNGKPINSLPPKEKPSDTTATLTTAATPGLAVNSDNIHTSLLSNATVKKYNSLFGLNDSDNSSTDPSQGLADTNAAKPQDIITPFPQIGSTDVTIQALAEKPESRKIAQVFSNALNNYLTDPEKFRETLVAVRPTDPTVDKNSQFVAVTDPTLFNQGTAATYLPTTPTPSPYGAEYTTQSNLAAVINTNLITSTFTPDSASTTEDFDSTTYKSSSEQKSSLELSAELEPPTPDSGEGEEFLQREQTQSFVKPRNELLRNKNKNSRITTIKPWSFIEEDDILDPLKINDGLMKPKTTTLSPYAYLPKEETTILPRSSSNSQRGKVRHGNTETTEPKHSSRLRSETSASSDPWQDIFDSYDLPKESLPSNTGLQRIANKLFGGLNENEAYHLRNVMAEAEHNRQVLRLLLLLIQTCDDQNGRALERSRKHLINALINMDGKIKDETHNGKSSHHKEKPLTTTEQLPVTTYRRTGSGEEFTTSTLNYASTTTDLPTTTLYGSHSNTDSSSNNNSGESTTTPKFVIKVEDNEKEASSSSLSTVAVNTEGNSDKRALELLKSLYSLASKFTSRR